MEAVDIYNDQPSTVRSQKSRITSLSTFLGENQKVHSDKLGIRKFAKACSKPFSSWGYQSDDNQSSITNEKPINHMTDDKSQAHFVEEAKSLNNESTKMEPFSLRNMTRRYMKKNQLNVPLSEAEVDNWKSHFDELTNNDDHHTQIQTQNTRSEQLPLNQAQSTQQHSYQQPLGEKKPFLLTNDNISNITGPGVTDMGLDLDIRFLINGIEEVDLKFSNFNNAELEFGKRVVRFKNFPFNVSVKAVVSQICGGPLEKVEIISKPGMLCPSDLENGKFPLRNCCLDIWFLSPDEANRFMTFTRTGLFLVNGHNFQPEWAPAHNQNRQRINYSDLNSIKYSYPFHDAAPTSISDEMIINQARRCIIMKKLIAKRGNKSSKHHYTDPLENFSRMNFEAMKKDFLQFGAVLEFYPVVSKKLCFIVHFFEVKSAIDAKHSFDDELSNFHEKWRGWTIWYGADPSEKPCIDV